jgi:hypothetical protein
MNNRIKELIKQSGGVGYDDDNNELTPVLVGRGLEKFAELIVEECLEACSRANEIRHFVPPTQEQVVLSCMCEIEKHFGVK